jgi:hypothetical protein
MRIRDRRNTGGECRVRDDDALPALAEGQRSDNALHCAFASPSAAPASVLHLNRESLVAFRGDDVCPVVSFASGVPTGIALGLEEMLDGVLEVAPGHLVDLFDGTC